MGRDYQKNIQLVIIHQEGCGGNFLARLYANLDLNSQLTFRTDVNLHPMILATGKIDNLRESLRRLYKEHSIIVTHCQNTDLLKEMFPCAKILQIYPYTHIGNVLYNISAKKLKTLLPNHVDNHLIHISEWYNKIKKRRPACQCIDYWELTDKTKVQQILEITFDQTQLNFFNSYWKSQLSYELNWPTDATTICELIEFWKLTDFDPWFAAWVIFVFEKINKLNEHNRQWSVDQQFKTWDDVKKIEYMYNQFDMPNKQLYND